MEFKKIDDTKFQCLLYEEDLEDNNISLDDFFRNDTAKIHGLLDVVMEEAHKSIGMIMDSGVMSLQLAPQPNHSILLTISSGKEDFNNMLRQAGERAAQIVSAGDDTDSVIKNYSDKNEFNTDKTKEGKKIFNDLNEPSAVSKNKKSKRDNKISSETASDDISANFIKANVAIFVFDSLDDVENFCCKCPKTWGINNSIYKNKSDGKLYLIMERGKCSQEKYKLYTKLLIEYARFDSSDVKRKYFIEEHFEPYIKRNAINAVKKYC